ncbi:hypothetical protein FSP39_023741 [Pinctada imbricata]|uniref:Allene oxide synthase-lipoxygenase protein n=1 Tax=Pinctada imbricata TaxID=66713 RepID=A0AA88YA28_PINIB|nr:hypothetical protein FSP39_023741 [Pinctada imbricata]
MGNCFQKPTVDFMIYVRTGDLKNAGTDANVKMTLYDDVGRETRDLELDNFFKNDFEAGANDSFPFKKIPNFGNKVTKIKFWRDNAGIASDWFVDRILVENRKSNDIFVFPVYRWIKSGREYVIVEYDTSLPQYDEYPDMRDMELLDKQNLYELEQKVPPEFPGLVLPVQVKNIPEDEQFSFNHKWNILKRKLKMIADKKFQMLFSSGNWDGLQHLKKVYTDTFGEPLGCTRWSNDIFFGWQRINSMNHSLVQLCTEIPDKLGVTDEMLRPFLEGWSLQQIIDAKRLFMVDLKVLEDLPCKSAEYKCPVPIALFFVNGENRLVPLAIQLYQQKAEDNPVFLPTDPPYTWMMAKMWYNLADASYHQSLTHLGFTHLIMEGIVVCAHRNLSPSHPLFKLLAPHFLYLIAINTRGLELLVAPGGWVDKTMNIGTKGMFNLIARGMAFWRMDVHGTLPEELKQRGVYCRNGKVLPNYYFRDDAILLYEAIKNYVTKYVKLYYDTPDKIKEDWELQNFGQEITKSRDEGGCGILGVPNNGKFETADHIILVFTSIIYTCSVAHASTNFPQYDEYAFPPNYPASMKGEPPKDKRELTEDDILRTLPDKETTLDIMTVTKILSDRGTNSLGDFEVQYVFEPKAKKIVEEFREDLKNISAEIKKRNEHRNPKYTWLDPEVVPNSISI